MATKQQTPNVFKYSNTEYSITVTLMNSTDKANAGFAEALDASDIEWIQYVSQVNSLVVTAKMAYLDKYAFIDKAIGQFNLFVDIQFSENYRPTDPTDSMGTPNPDREFSMEFIVQNIRPVNRVANCIQYELDLVSVNWHKCIANVQFSNYNKPPESLFDIFKTCLASQDLAPDKDSFDNAKQVVSMNYITSQNDNMFTVANYLFHKMYYLPNRDQSMKFFVYNIYTGKYHIVDMADKNSFIGDMTTTVLSFFKSNAELLTQQEATNLGSFAHPCSRTDLFKSMFTRKVIGFDYDGNQFVNYDMDAKEIKIYVNNGLDEDGYISKYQDVDVDPKHKRFQSNPYWDNELNVYGEIIDAVTQNDAVVLNITGDIMRQAGALVNVVIDRDMGSLANDTPAELKNLRGKYKQYERLWMTSKVINIVKPKEGTFRQQIALFRNFLPQDKTLPLLMYK